MLVFLNEINEINLNFYYKTMIMKQTIFGSSKVDGTSKNPECESVRDFYLFTLHYSLLLNLRILDFWEVIVNSEKVGCEALQRHIINVHF